MALFLIAKKSRRELSEDSGPGLRGYGGIPLIHREQRKAMAIRDVEHSVRFLQVVNFGVVQGGEIGSVLLESSVC